MGSNNGDVSSTGPINIAAVENPFKISGAVDEMKNFCYWQNLFELDSRARLISLSNRDINFKRHDKFQETEGNFKRH